MSTAPDPPLAEQISQFVRFSEGHNTLVIDVVALRRISGLALRAASVKGYGDFLDNRGDDRIPVWNMVPWLRLEQAAIDPARYQALLDLVEPVEAFVRVFVKPPTFGSKEFKGAAPIIKKQVLQSAAKERWEDTRKVTPESIKKLCAALRRGENMSIAAWEAGMSIPTARAVCMRRYPHMTPDLDAAWMDSFGQSEARSMRMFPKVAQNRLTRAAADQNKAELLRRMFARLKKDSKSKSPRVREEATKALALSKLQISKITGQKSSEWGPESSLAWLETFGSGQ